LLGIAKEKTVEIDRLREMLKEHGYSDEDINAALRRTTIAESQGQ